MMWSVTIVPIRSGSTRNVASALSAVVATETDSPALRNTVSRTVNCSGLSSIRRTCLKPCSIPNPYLLPTRCGGRWPPPALDSTLLSLHFLLRPQPVLLRRASMTAPLHVQFVGAATDLLFQIGNNGPVAC